jgi:hypothetical protein
MSSKPQKYKVVYRFRCPRGHANLGEDRFEADSQAAAKEKFVSDPSSLSCLRCTEVCDRQSVEIIGTELLPQYPSYACIGYICECGERVAVLRWESNTSICPPDRVSVSCSKGHKREITNFGTLTEFWNEEVN